MGIFNKPKQNNVVPTPPAPQPQEIKISENQASTEKKNFLDDLMALASQSDAELEEIIFALDVAKIVLISQALNNE